MNPTPQNQEDEALKALEIAMDEECAKAHDDHRKARENAVMRYVMDRMADTVGMCTKRRWGRS